VEIPESTRTGLFPLPSPSRRRTMPIRDRAAGASAVDRRRRRRTGNRSARCSSTARRHNDGHGGHGGHAGCITSTVNFEGGSDSASPPGRVGHESNLKALPRWTCWRSRCTTVYYKSRCAVYCRYKVCDWVQGPAAHKFILISESRHGTVCRKRRGRGLGAGLRLSAGEERAWSSPADHIAADCFDSRPRRA
jgi:hypothetical protein